MALSDQEDLVSWYLWQWVRHADLCDLEPPSVTLNSTVSSDEDAFWVEAQLPLLKCTPPEHVI